MPRNTQRKYHRGGSISPEDSSLQKDYDKISKDYQKLIRIHDKLSKDYDHLLYQHKILIKKHQKMHSQKSESTLKKANI
jgi:hypothetical protein